MDYLISPYDYADTYHTVLLFFVLITWLSAQGSTISSISNLNAKKFLGVVLLLFTITFMGFRPVSGAFGDMVIYANDFDRILAGIKSKKEFEWVFQRWLNFHTQYFTKTFFFFDTTVVYVGMIFLATKKIFKEYYFYAFLILVGSFSFWSYGTNGIRNGMATSIFIFALALYPKTLWVILIGFFTTLIHGSMKLPLFCLVLALFTYKGIRYYFYFWFVCIILSLALGGFWENLFAILGFGDEKSKEYLVGKGYAHEFSKTGFRWDFLLYSASAVYAIWYFIIKRKFQDKLYYILSITYLLANAFWLLVIRANFSNRFAYLSWFLMGLVIIYPTLKQNFFKNQHRVIGNILFLYYAFTYIMNVIVY